MGNGSPTGVVSFLFTDVEGSTRLWDEDPMGMAASLEVHDAIVRRVFELRDGYVVSTSGDGFAVAFADAVAAIEAAVEAQLLLHRADWPGPTLRVRIGIHSGPATERDGDYFGPTVNRAARIMAAGHGGQVLVSAATAGAFEGHAGDGVSVADLGVHHLRDLSEPEHLYEVRHRVLPTIVRPLRTVDARRHNLPDPLTSLVGRSDDIGVVASLLERQRLVVLSGVGGTGKTRLAIEVARRALADRDRWPDGAWMAELASVRGDDDVMTAIGETWRLRPGDGITMDVAVLRYLFRRRLLLVVDNCEHVIGGATAAIEAILSGCPDVSILATSRRPLGIPGEVSYVVPPLPVPRLQNPELGNPAVRLFVDRARRVRIDYEPDESDLRDIGRIVTALDGIPLGVELAAARVRFVSVDELVRRVDTLLEAANGASVEPRQRTMSAAIEWSHRLLDDDERTVFRRLGIFPARFSPEAATMVCEGSGVHPGRVSAVLDRLVEQSLLVAERDREGRARLRMLQPIRQFARNQLDAGGDADVVAAAHARAVIAFMSEAASHLRGPDQLSWGRRIDEEYPNVRFAFSTLLDMAEIDLYLDLAFDLVPYWSPRGMHVEALRTLRAGLEADPGSGDAGRIARGWWSVALLGTQITRADAVDAAREGLRLARTLERRALAGALELQLGVALWHTSAHPSYAEHLRNGWRTLADGGSTGWWETRWEEAFWRMAAAGSFPLDPPDAAIDHAKAAIAGFEAVGDRVHLAAALAETSRLDRVADKAWVMENLERAVDLLQGADAPFWEGHALYYLGSSRFAADDHEGAIDVLEAAAELLGAASDLYCWARAARGAIFARIQLGQTDGLEAPMRAILRTLPLLPRRSVADPLTLDVTAHLLAALGRAGEAAVVLGAAMEGTIPVGLFTRRVARNRSLAGRLREALGPDVFAGALREGAEVEVDDLYAKAVGWLGGDAGW